VGLLACTRSVRGRLTIYNSFDLQFYNFVLFLVLEEV
jgi:hypothetical protein